jgi:hypothetical protein
MSGNEAEVSGGDLITVRDAYIAMFRFVEAYWKLGQKQDPLTLLVSDMAINADPKGSDRLSTSDPALWSDWLKAVKAARSGPPPDWFDPNRL